jgi:hypothetical protein
LPIALGFTCLVPVSSSCSGTPPLLLRGWTAAPSVLALRHRSGHDRAGCGRILAHPLQRKEGQVLKGTGERWLAVTGSGGRRPCGRRDRNKRRGKAEWRRGGVPLRRCAILGAFASTRAMQFPCRAAGRAWSEGKYSAGRLGRPQRRYERECTAETRGAKGQYRKEWPCSRQVYPTGEPPSRFAFYPTPITVSSFGRRRTAR